MLEIKAGKFRVALLCLFCLLLAGVSLVAYRHCAKEAHQPLHLLPHTSYPAFIDDLDRPSLIAATHRHLTFLKKQNPNQIIYLGTDPYSYAWLRHSAEVFLELLNQDPSQGELQRFLSNNYRIFQAGGRRDHGKRRMLVTGYYEPAFEASLVKQPPYLIPIYSRPSSLVTVSDESGAQRIGRYDQEHHVTAYWSRAEIETNPDLLRGYELAYLKDPFDAFLLHVQGSGRLRLPDKTEKPVRFAASNGLEYKSIGKLLVDEKIMSLAEVTIPALRQYLNKNPSQLQRILHHNPRFIFFSWGNEEGPRGSSGEVLTPGRSIAIDHTALPGGVLGYLISRIPDMGPGGTVDGWHFLSRFVFPQDSGAAIKGPGRVDIFFGHGDYAEFAANHMKEEGKLYFLVKIKPPPSS